MDKIVLGIAMRLIGRPFWTEIRNVRSEWLSSFFWYPSCFSEVRQAPLKRGMAKPE